MDHEARHEGTVSVPSETGCLLEGSDALFAQSRTISNHSSDLQNSAFMRMKKAVLGSKGCRIAYYGQNASCESVVQKQMAWFSEKQVFRECFENLI